MGSIIPIAGIVQWISGIILAVVTMRRSRRFGPAGRWPRLIAALAVLVFLLAPVELALARLGGGALIARWAPPNFADDGWQLVAVLLASAAAWLLLFLAAVWNMILGIGERRRVAAAELRRRTQRVRR